MRAVKKNLPCLLLAAAVAIFATGCDLGAVVVDIIGYGGYGGGYYGGGYGGGYDDYYYDDYYYDDYYYGGF